MAFSRAKLITGRVATSALVLAGCSSGGEDDAAGGGGESYRIGINQLVQHPALDSATAGFK
ncbi:sugar ABC transporter substrate-binding protein, partial [Mycobacterium tuberculosis]|nr:sugar ABC transporter substrate-binding protein [Mycobacterium tuberculosis]